MHTLARKNGWCCVPYCRNHAVDAHHIIERRLFPDGGYYLDNGAGVCKEHHLLAETTQLSCDELREACGIDTVVLPPHFYPDERYDKWGNVILPNGRRLKGELFEDPSVQKIITPVLHLFDNRVKYPRTWHLPWSESVNKDDRSLSLETVSAWYGTEVVVTEKMDGENTTMYRDYLHARSVEFNSHVSRNWIKNYHAQIAANIPEGMRICGENLWAKHSIAYENLPSYFMVFSMWEGTRCLSWDETVEWCALLNLDMVPMLYRGPFSLKLDLPVLPREFHEGYVIRPARSFTLREFPTHVGKYVRKNHVQTHGHWMRSQFTPNKLAGSNG